MQRGGREQLQRGQRGEHRLARGVASVDDRPEQSHARRAKRRGGGGRGLHCLLPRLLAVAALWHARPQALLQAVEQQRQKAGAQRVRAQRRVGTERRELLRTGGADARLEQFVGEHREQARDLERVERAVHARAAARGVGAPHAGRGRGEEVRVERSGRRRGGELVGPAEHGDELRGGVRGERLGGVQEEAERGAEARGGRQPRQHGGEQLARVEGGLCLRRQHLVFVAALLLAVRATGLRAEKPRLQHRQQWRERRHLSVREARQTVHQHGVRQLREARRARRRCRRVFRLRRGRPVGMQRKANEEGERGGAAKVVSEVAPVVRRPRHACLRLRSREVRVFLLDIAAAAAAAGCVGATERGEELCEERLAHGRPRVGEAAEQQRLRRGRVRRRAAGGAERDEQLQQAGVQRRLALEQQRGQARGQLASPRVERRRVRRRERVGRRGGQAEAALDESARAARRALDLRGGGGGARGGRL